MFSTFEGNSTATRTIEPGITKFPFHYQLPPNIPGSFKGKYGGVKYTVEVTCKRYWKSDKRDQKELEVLGTYFTTQAEYVPRSFNTTKSVWCGIESELQGMSHAKIKAEFSIAKSVFKLGEKLHFILKVKNETPMEFRKVHVNLLQVNLKIIADF